MATPGQEPANGTHVSWRELNLALAPIKTLIEDNRRKMDEIAKGVDILLEERVIAKRLHKDEKYRADRNRFWLGLLATLFCGVGATSLGYFLNVWVG